MSTYTVGRGDRDRSLGLKLFALFTGITIPVVMFIGLWLAISADKARNDAHRAVAQAQSAATSMSSMPGMATSTGSAAGGAVATPSFAGAAPADADAAAMRHDLTKAEQMTPDWVTWNGYAGQYKTHPLTAQPDQTVRFWVVDAGPSLNTEFHVVGTVLERAWVNADLIDAPQHDIQTAIVPAGGGGVFDVKIAQRGLYPFVSHSFASVQMGQVGLLNVGNVPGTMSH